ncbi:hypothetical protein NDU88_003045 [Pleurodeles waltl]|uniref:Uncharacterized protein n=1 Tax=Pleurodeles waltl TaxID=8319 RepID=A0AAV7P8E8_PLEWA|nr:hypothetical protein NDU88_003045 [Pleurodeles waltl]
MSAGPGFPYSGPWSHRSLVPPFPGSSLLPALQLHRLTPLPMLTNPRFLQREEPLRPEITEELRLRAEPRGN